MNINSRLILALLLVFSALCFPSCDNKSSSAETETQVELPPDPSTVFANFELQFLEKELPLSFPYDTQVFGNALADEVKKNFLPKEGNIFPAYRFPLKDGYRGFIAFEDASGNFQVVLHVFSPDNKPVDERIVAGPVGNQLLDSEFSSGGTWTETLRDRAEDTNLPTGEGVTTTWTIDGNGKIIAQ